MKILCGITSLTGLASFAAVVAHQWVACCSCQYWCSASRDQLLVLARGVLSQVDRARDCCHRPLQRPLPHRVLNGITIIISTTVLILKNGGLAVCCRHRFRGLPLRKRQLAAVICRSCGSVLQLLKVSRHQRCNVQHRGDIMKRVIRPQARPPFGLSGGTILPAVGFTAGIFDWVPGGAAELGVNHSLSK
jgi:hypothetical protein